MFLYGLSALLMVALMACAPPPDEVIRLGIASAPANLDPRFGKQNIVIDIDHLFNHV
jgi:hypothetical protein